MNNYNDQITSISNIVKKDLTKLFSKKLNKSIGTKNELVTNILNSEDNFITNTYKSGDIIFSQELENLFSRELFNSNLEINGNLKCKKLIADELDFLDISIITNSDEFINAVDNISYSLNTVCNNLGYLVLDPLTGTGLEGPQNLDRISLNGGLNNSSGSSGFLVVDYIRNRKSSDGGTSGSYDRGFLGDFYGKTILRTSDDNENSRNKGELLIDSSNKIDIYALSGGITINCKTKILMGNDVNNTEIEQLGLGQVTFTGNVDANSGLDITGTLSLNNSELTATVDELNTLNISASTEEITEAGPITLNKSLVKLNTATGSFTITLDPPNTAQHGKTMIIQMTNDTNNVQLTSTNIIGLSEINNPTFSNINDTLVLLGIEGKWLVIKEYGITFT